MKNKVIFSKEYCPSKFECLEILKSYGTPSHVQEHCDAVGETAKSIAIELSKKGIDLNIDLVASAGYLHDIARVHRKHELVGAEYLNSIGLKDVSEVIKDHTKHKIKMDVNLLDEEDILCIADRVVLEGRFVGPRKRMQYIKNKAIKKYGPDSELFLDEVINQFTEFVGRLEEFIGDDIYNIVPNYIR